MKKVQIFLIFIFLSSTQLMGQEIRFSFDSLQSTFTKSLAINKLILKDNELTIICSFSNKDMRHVLISKKYDIYINSEKKYYKSSSVAITSKNDSISLLTMVFPNYIDTLDEIDLFSDCETCFYFKGIHILRPYDVFALDNGSIIQAILIEEGINQIRYKYVGSENDSIFSVPPDQVKCIRYRVQQENKSDEQGKNINYKPQTKHDIIVLFSKKEINAVILEVGINEVKYKKSDYTDGPTFSVLKKDVYLIKYKNGQTDTLNSYSDYIAKQDQPVYEKMHEVNTLYYGGPVSFGLSIGGGGLVGIPIRYYMTELVDLELNFGVKPVLTQTKTQTNTQTDISLNFFYTGGFDFYFTKKYNPFKDQVKMNGIFIKGGGSAGSRFTEALGAVGWSYERFKSERQSFTIQLGMGLIRLHDKDYNHYSSSPYQQIDLEEYTDKLLIFWKFGWNFY